MKTKLQFHDVHSYSSFIEDKKYNSTPAIPSKGDVVLSDNDRHRQVRAVTYIYLKDEVIVNIEVGDVE